jgi:hypothetical protein
MANDLTTSGGSALVRTGNLPQLLNQVRPQWQARNLIERVRKLAEVDVSSACQRIFNAAIHDLREKIKIAGIDIAGEAADQHKLPPVRKEEDIESYSTKSIIDLAYRMGLINRPEWRRISRCYEIRRDLEHEDDEYEAGVEDLVYVFHTCVDVVLSRDPIQLVKLTDFKDLVEQAGASVPDEVLVEDFAQAPQPRQTEIAKFLISTALDKTKPDLVQQNAYTALGFIADKINPHVRTNLGTHLQEKVGRTITDRQARVAQVAGLMPYIRQAARSNFFEGLYQEMRRVGYDWSGYDKHGEILRTFAECGGLDACPPEQKEKIVRWMVLTYIGKPGGVTQYGNLRKVFYSNTAAPLIREEIEKAGSSLRDIMTKLREDKNVKAACSNTDVSRRFEDLFDEVEND